MYLVTGASGHLGRAVVENLLSRHNIAPGKLIVTTRNADKLADLAGRGVVVRTASFDDEAALAKAFAGAERLLIVSTDALDLEGTRLAQHRRAISAAAKAGVGHVLYTSLPNPETSAVLFAPDHAGTEKAIADSTIPGWTILRNNWYFENLFHSIPRALQSGQWYTANGSGQIAHIARGDLARAAAAALASTDKSKKTFTLTGKEAMTTADIAKRISAATGKPLAVVDVPLEGLIKGMRDAGLPEPVARIFASFDAAIARGDLAGVTSDYRTLTGSDPQSFDSWLSANAGALAA